MEEYEIHISISNNWLATYALMQFKKSQKMSDLTFPLSGEFPFQSLRQGHDVHI
jgi:hypothetical protein